MKTHFLKFGAILALCMLNSLCASYGQSTCVLPTGCTSPLASPNPYIEVGGVAGIERYLARSIFMGNLALENMARPYWTSDRDDPACVPHNRYCPEQYCKDITMLADLNASFIMGGAGRFGAEMTITNQSNNHSDYRAAAAGVVTDINAAYDCKGQRHPIIQASIFEYVSENIYMSNGVLVHGDNDIDLIEIPEYVIGDYEDEMDTAEKAIYLDSPKHPKHGLKFKIDNVAYDWGGKTPDYEKIEGRMWMYFLATTYIALGYTSLHMGQPGIWGRLQYYAHAQYPNHEQDVHRMLNLINSGMEKIRAYARDHAHTDLLLMAEAAAIDEEYYFTNNGTRAKNYYYGTDADYASAATRRLIFDYKGIPLRAQEVVSNAEIDADNGPSTVCQSNVPISANMFANTPCAGLNNAVIGPCNGYGVYENGYHQVSNYGPDAGGIGHYGQSYTQTPAQIGFDYGNGFIDDHKGGFLEWGVYPNGIYPNNVGSTRGRESTWGYDDGYWFTSELGGSPACQAYWIGSQSKVARLVAESKTFLTVPGWLPAFNGETRTIGNTTRQARVYDEFYLSKTQAALDTVRARWDVSTLPNIQINAEPCAGEAYPGVCVLANGNKGKYLRLPSITMSVTNPSVSSIYTWHIQRPDGTWEPFTYGNSRVFTPTMTGAYQIGLRQDDLGLPASMFGSRAITTPTQVDATCCDQSQRAITQPVAVRAMSKTEELDMVRQSLAAKAIPPSAYSLGRLSVDAFPNPAASTISITITSEAQNPIKATIINALGQQVGALNTSGYQSGQLELDYDLAGLPQGIYFLRVVQGNQQRTVKVMRN